MQHDRAWLRARSTRAAMVSLEWNDQHCHIVGDLRPAKVAIPAKRRAAYDGCAARAGPPSDASNGAGRRQAGVGSSSGKQSANAGWIPAIRFATTVLPDKMASSIPVPVSRPFELCTTWISNGTG